MNNRLVIAALILTLVAAPCVKLSGVAASVVAQTASIPDAADPTGWTATFLSGDEAATAVQDGDGRPACQKICKKWQAVVPRSADAVVVAMNVTLLLADIVQDETRPGDHAVPTLGARGPPEPSGPVFDHFFARTSRFLS